MPHTYVKQEDELDRLFGGRFTDNGAAELKDYGRNLEDDIRVSLDDFDDFDDFDDIDDMSDMFF